MITSKLNQYAAAFQSGAAALCLRQAEYKAGVFADETSELVKQYYEQKLPEKIAAKADEDMKSLDEVGVIDEIRTNVLALQEKDREAYIKDAVLTKFKDWSDSLLSNEVRQIMMRDSLSRFWYNSLWSFAVKLDAMLLHYGIDLMRLQEECGVYLQTERNMSMLGYYIRSKEYAQKCVDAITKKREPQQEERPVNEVKYQQADKNAAEARGINQERLREYFNQKFLGHNSKKTNYIGHLMKDLTKDMSDKYFAKIFLLMYKSPNLISKPQTFKAFYKDMCEITGVEYVDGYKPNQLKMNEEEKKDYYYLTDKIE